MPTTFLSYLTHFLGAKPCVVGTICYYRPTPHSRANSRYNYFMLFAIPIYFRVLFSTLEIEYSTRSYKRVIILLLLVLIKYFSDMFRLIADQQRRSNQKKLSLLLSDCIQVPRVLGEIAGTNHSKLKMLHC